MIEYIDMSIKAVSIAFADWLVQNYYSTDVHGAWYDWESGAMYSTEELYETFINNLHDVRKN